MIVSGYLFFAVWIFSMNTEMLVLSSIAFASVYGRKKLFRLSSGGMMVISNPVNWLWKASSANQIRIELPVLMDVQTTKDGREMDVP